jgi:hypothetical protein
MMASACGDDGQGHGGELGCSTLTTRGADLLPADYAHPADLELARKSGPAVLSCYLTRVVLNARNAECKCAGGATASADALEVCQGAGVVLPAAVECLGAWASASCFDVYGQGGFPPPCGFGPPVEADAGGQP